MARLIRTEKEIEGRFEEVWTVVEEDTLEQWPSGPLAVVGRGATRLDGFQRARGEARYTADLRLPGMLHAVTLRSPHARARVASLDFEAALALPGVRLAVGPDDVKELFAEPGYHGAPVAAVVADTALAARAGVEAIAVEWELLEPVLDAEQAIQAGSLLGEDHYERGDIERGLADADEIVEGMYRTQVVLHNSLETHVSLCEWHADELTAYVSTQYLWGVRSELAEAFDLPEEHVRVVCEFMGGGFGSKESARQTILTARLARLAGRPVMWQLSRREEHLDAGNRNATVQRLRLGARSDGTLTAIEGEYVLPIGFGGWLASPAGPAQLLYDCDHVRTSCHGARVNTPPMMSFRAPGFVEGTFALECSLDRLAAVLGVDPLEIRRRNYATADPRDGIPFSDKRLDRCYDLAEKHWDRRHEVRARSDERWRRGVGLASQIWYGGGGPPSHAWIRLGSDGRAHVVTAMQDIGTGSRTMAAMIAAEELALPLDRVTVQLGDTARGPYATLSAGSATTPSVGPAVRAAAADVRRQLLELAAQRFEVDEATLSLQGGRIVGEGGSSWPIEELTGLLASAQLTGTGSRGPNPAGMRVLTFGVQVAEVAVDVETGEVRVERIAAVHDVGRIINPLGARSQVEGGIIQALGHTFSEQRLLDPGTGRVLTQTLDAYRLPTIADVPEIVCEFVDVPDANLTNLGSKGLGEPPIIPTAAAISNAIRDATGAEVHSLPISREELLRALSDSRRQSAQKGSGDGWSSVDPHRSTKRPATWATEPSRLPGGRRSCRCCATGSCRRRRSSTSAAFCPRGSAEAASVRAPRWPRSRPTRTSRRRSARPAASRRRPSSGTWARSAATCCRPRAAGTGVSATPAGCTAATAASHATASTASTRSSPTTSAPPPTPRIRPRRCSRSERRCTPTAARCRSATSTGCRPTTTRAPRRSSRASSSSRSRCPSRTRASTSRRWTGDAGRSRSWASRRREPPAR